MPKVLTFTLPPAANEYVHGYPLLQGPRQRFSRQAGALYVEWARGELAEFRKPVVNIPGTTVQRYSRSVVDESGRDLGLIRYYTGFNLFETNRLSNVLLNAVLPDKQAPMQELPLNSLTRIFREVLTAHGNNTRIIEPLLTTLEQLRTDLGRPLTAKDIDRKFFGQVAAVPAPVTATDNDNDENNGDDEMNDADAPDAGEDDAVEEAADDGNSAGPAGRQQLLNAMEGLRVNFNQRLQELRQMILDTTGGAAAANTGGGGGDEDTPMSNSN